MPADPISTANAAVAQITSAIRNAAHAVGTSFSYLLATAKVESNFNPEAQAKTSSAQGLFQFIEQTWLSVMKEAGPRLGYADYAAAITKTPSGRMDVADPAMRKKILGLRQDPEANAAMAGAFTNKNASILRTRLGRAPTDGELYIAHFLGAGGAGKLIKAASTGNERADNLFPGAARANRSIFYDRAGRARSASEVYATLTKRYEVARVSTARVVASAAAPDATKAADPAGTAQAFAATQPPVSRANNSAPVFHALFHSGERNQAVAPRINQLWTAPPSTQIADAAGVGPAQPQAKGRPFDLFQNATPNISGLFTGRG